MRKYLQSALRQAQDDNLWAQDDSLIAQDDRLQAHVHNLNSQDKKLSI